MVLTGLVFVEEDKETDEEDELLEEVTSTEGILPKVQYEIGGCRVVGN